MPAKGHVSRFSDGLRIQIKVIKALMIRELVTRFGRENIGFLWIMVEPLLFASLVGTVWTFLKGPTSHGIGVLAFVISGYIPLTFMRHCFNRSARVFVANSALLYHRQVKVLDFVVVRVQLEAIGATMAYIFAAIVLAFFDVFPIPVDIVSLLGGWMVYIFFVFSMCTLLSPLSEVSDVVERLVPITVYLSIPFSGVFNLAEWLPPNIRDVLMWSPMVSGMELMRYGLFGDVMVPYYDLPKALGVSLASLLFGLILTRRMRRNLSVS